MRRRARTCDIERLTGLTWEGYTTPAHKNLGTYGYCGVCGHGSREERWDGEFIDPQTGAKVIAHARKHYWGDWVVTLESPTGETICLSGCDHVCEEDLRERGH